MTAQFFMSSRPVVIPVVNLAPFEKMRFLTADSGEYMDIGEYGENEIVVSGLL